MPEVQKPVLEHAAPKADQNQGLDGRLADESLPEGNDDVKRVTNGVTRISGYTYEIRPELLDDPDQIKNVTVGLPNGLTAKFIRSGGWTLVNQ